MINGIELPYKKLDQKMTVDSKIIKPHETVERIITNVKKLKRERWYITKDCITGKLKKRKFEDIEESD